MGRPFFARPNRQKQLLAVREPARHSEKSEDSALGTVVLVVRCARRVRRVKGTQTQKVIVLDS